MKLCSQLAAFPLIGLIATLTVSTASGAPTDLDTSFGVGGIVTSDLSPIAALQPDGKLLVAGTVLQTSPAKLSWRIRRYLADGSSDLSFGTNSSVIVSFDLINVGGDTPSGIALLPDGRFVVAGTDQGGCGPGGCGETTLIVARFNTDGSLDSSFGGGGKLVAAGGADSVAIQSDGKMLTFSSSGGFILGPVPTPVLQRFSNNGTPDAGFAPAIACVGRGAMHLDADGKIVIATAMTRSPSAYGICVTRLNVDGTADASFGTQGTAFIGAGAFATLTDFLIDAAGGIVVAGATIAPTLFRLNADGSADTHFGTSGQAPLAALQFLTAIGGDCHGRTIVAGRPTNGSGYFLIARFLPDGSVDPAFTATPPGSAPTGLLSFDVEQLLVRPSGRIVALAVQDFPAPSFFSILNIIQYQGDSPCGETVAVEYYYAAWNYYFETAFPDEIAALDGGAFGGAWQRTGETFNVWPQPNASASPTCRFFSTAFAPKSSHFYTPFPAECAIVKANPSWQFESIAFYVQIPTGYGTGNGSCPQGTVALYRAYNNGMGGAPNHRYTTSLATLDTMLAQGWVFEGEANTKVFACAPQ